MNFCWTHPFTYRSDSDIHGIGRFAKDVIHKDEVCFVVGGLACSLGNTKWETGLLLDENWILQLPLESGYEIYMNHSCHPNVYIDGQVIFRALSDIKPGEELTVDYASFMILDRMIIEKCFCGSSKCRKSVHGRDYLTLNLPLSWYAQKKKKA